RGSAMKFSIVATLTGSYWRQRPPSPRNVGMPLSAEMPAPVSATPRVAIASSAAAASTSGALLSLVARRGRGEHELRAVAPADRGVLLCRALRREVDPRRTRRLPDRDDLVDPELVRRLALELHARHLLDGDVVLALLERRLADEHGEGRRDAAEPRRGVDGIAERRVLKPVAAPHVADDGGAGVDADAPADRGQPARGEPGLERVRLRDHVVRAAHRPERVVLLRHGRIPDRDDLVADVLVDGAVPLED